MDRGRALGGVGMTTIAQGHRADAILAKLVEIAPCRVRLTFRNGMRETGELTFRVFHGGEVLDPLIDGRGGIVLHTALARIERMSANGRYELVGEVAPPAGEVSQ